MEISLEGKRAVVCGSTQGIGKAVAVELARSGATVTLVARNEGDLKEASAELSVDKGQTHSYICSDFTRPEELKQHIDEYVAKNSRNHILVNNTGGPNPGAAFDAALVEFSSAFSQHLICNQILTQALVPGMKAEGYGRIVNIISTSVKQPIKGLGVSNTIRGAVSSWSKTLASELGRFGITVNNILPGATKTARLHSIIQTQADRLGKTIDDVSNAMISSIPAGRFGEAKEIAFAAAFLASPAASYINGINLPVDGGRTDCL